MAVPGVALLGWLPVLLLLGNPGPTDAVQGTCDISKLQVRRRGRARGGGDLPRVSCLSCSCDTDLWGWEQVVGCCRRTSVVPFSDVGVDGARSDSTARCCCVGADKTGAGGPLYRSDRGEQGLSTVSPAVQSPLCSTSVLHMLPMLFAPSAPPRRLPSTRVVFPQLLCAQVARP